MTRTQRSGAFTQPSFWYQFNPWMEELSKLVEGYQQLLSQEKRHENDMAAFQVKKTQLPHNVQNASIIERDSQAFAVEAERIRRNKIIYEGKLNSVSGRVEAQHQDMVQDLRYVDGLSEEKYIQFLKSFKTLLESAVDLPCFKTVSYLEIQAAIKKYFPTDKN
jgi:hypothetical protein